MKPNPSTIQKDVSQNVRNQYERFPYPDFDLQWDRPGLLVSGHLELMCQVLWAGKKSPKGLRVLDAGCGTGGPLVAMALKYPEADITAIDFSETSLQKAQQLAEKYGAANIRFFNIPIENLSELGLTFDLVISSGVLHHLPQPAEGLKAIKNSLDPQGAVSIMLYGKYGRTGIYMLQDALRHITQLSSNQLDSEKIQMAYRIANEVPPHHPMAQRGRGREMQEGKDAGIVDLLLHANDIPFDVPAVYRLCKDAGMVFHRWLFPLIYNLENFFTDPLLLNRVKRSNMSRPQQETLAELAHGNNSKHSFFAVGPEFKSPIASYKNGNWRQMHAKLTPCMAWNRTVPIPGKKDSFAIPFTIIQDAWGPMEVSRWQLLFLGSITEDITMEQALQSPQVQQALPFREKEEIDRQVEQLLEKALQRLALVFLDRE